jgi:hypothetical protein
MVQLTFYLADVQDLVKYNERAKITGYLGKWMWKVAGLRPKELTAVEIGWTTKAGRPSLGPTDILVYVTSNVTSIDDDRSVISANGGDVSQAIENPKVLGLTSVDATRQEALSEVYYGRALFPREVAGAAFHEAAHNKSLQGMEMHGKKDGFLVEVPVFAGDPTEANLEFLATHVLANVRQKLVPQNILTSKWYKGGP